MLAMNDNAVFLTDRGVSIASKPAPTKNCAVFEPVGASLLAIQTPRSVRNTALSFIAGKPAPTKNCAAFDPVGAGLLAIQTPRSVKNTALSFFASKLRSYRGRCDVFKECLADWPGALS